MRRVIPHLLFVLLLFGAGQTRLCAQTTPQPAQDKHGLWGYRLPDEKKFAIKPAFAEAKPFTKHRVAVVAVMKGGEKRYGILGWDGGLVQKPNFLAIQPLGELFLCKDSRYWGLLDSNGATLLACRFARIEQKPKCLLATDEAGKKSLYRLTAQGTAAHSLALIATCDALQEAGGASILRTAAGCTVLDAGCQPVLTDCKDVSVLSPRLFKVVLADGRANLYANDGGTLRAWFSTPPKSLTVQRLYGQDLFVAAGDYGDIVDVQTGKRLLQGIKVVHTTPEHIYCCAMRPGKYQKADAEADALVTALYTTDGRGRIKESRSYDRIDASGLPFERFSVNIRNAFARSFRERFVKDLYISRSRPIAAADATPLGEQEVQEADGNIYTYPTLFGDAARLFFYRRDPSQSPTRTAGIVPNRLHIWGQTLALPDLLPHIDFGQIRRFVPDRYLLLLDEAGDVPFFEGAVLAYHTVQDAAPEVVYTEPRYVLLGGALIEVNSGRHLLPRSSSAAFLSFIPASDDHQPQTPARTLTIDGTGDFRFMRYGTSGNLYCYWRDPNGDDDAIDFRSPVFLLNPRFEMELAVRPDDGERFTDLIEWQGKLYLCGATQKKGYVGFDNPLLRVVDLQTHQVHDVDLPVQSDKDWCFTQILGIKGDTLLLQDTRHRIQTLPLHL